MAYIERDGVKVYFEDHGTGPGVLLSHGFSCSSTMWRDQVEVLQDRYRVMTWDMRGHGQSDYPDDPEAYSEAHTAADMAAILDACGVQKAMVGGLSLGGCASLGFHIAHPGRTAGLMLFDTGPGFRKDEARAAWNDVAYKRAAAFEANGLAELGDGPAVQIAGHRDATGLAHAARGMLAQSNAAMLGTAARHTNICKRRRMGLSWRWLFRRGHASAISHRIADDRRVCRIAPMRER